MSYKHKYFHQKDLSIKNQCFKYYLSPILLKNNFKHGFFTKTSSEINLSSLSNNLKINSRDCVLNQIHSNHIVFGSKTQGNEIVEADGMISDKHNQNLWIYTADCMPILFADKRKRLVASIHCGRRGLENKIIKKILKNLYDEGCLKEDLLIAIGPSISKKNYLIDKKTLKNFYVHTALDYSIASLDHKDILLTLKKLENSERNVLIPLDLKKYAHIQLLNENIPNANIDITNLCTYKSDYEFHSWRRTRTFSRQWNFISS